MESPQKQHSTNSPSNTSMTYTWEQQNFYDTTQMLMYAFISDVKKKGPV
jgi:hypothetical protein